MKIRNLLSLFLGGVMMLGMHSCMSDFTEDESVKVVSKGEKISIKVSMPQCEEDKKGSRIIYTDNDLSLKWEKGDQLALVGYDDKGNPVGKSVLSLAIVNDQNAGIFSGTTVNGATEYDVYYPASAVDDKGNVIIDYNKQVQVGDNNTAHLKNFILLKQADQRRLTANEILLKERDINLLMQNSIMKFDLSKIKTKKFQIQNLMSLEWMVNNGGVKTLISLGVKNVNIKDTKSFTGFLCFPNSMKIGKEGITTVFLREDTKPGDPTENFDNCLFYELEISKDIVYKSNHRYIATVNGGWSVSTKQKSKYRVYYESNVPLDKNVFSPKPVSVAFDETNGLGYVDFTKTANDEEGEYKEIKIHNINNPKLTDLELHGILEVGENAFKGCKNLVHLTLPESLEEIGKNAFTDCAKLETLTIKAITPPEISNGGINNNVKIFVPAGSVNRYKNNKYWKQYKDQISAIP